MKKTFKKFIPLFGILMTFLAASPAAQIFAKGMVDDEGTVSTAAIPVALIIGLIVGLITAFSLKGQLKSVHTQRAAANYLVSNSLNLTEQRDYFLYKTIEKKEKVKQATQTGDKQ